MSNRTVTILVALFLAAMGVLFLINIMGIFAVKADEKYVAFNDIRGMAVYHAGKPYTLNFDQQTESIRFLNDSSAVDKTDITPLEVSRIVIYRYGKQLDIEITPIMYQNGELIFSAPLWDNEHYLKENSRGRLKKLLSQTYDP